MPVVHEGTLVPTPGRILIVASRFNQLVVNQLVTGALEALGRHGIPEANVEIVRVQGPLKFRRLPKRPLKQVVLPA